MLWLKYHAKESQSIACCLGEKSYSIAAVKDNKKILFANHREFPNKLPGEMTQCLVEDVKRLQVVGEPCRIILAQELYQLLLMDALDLPEEELAKAFRWRLKGLVDYPLNDIAVDAFPIPLHGMVGQRKKVFVAVTPLSGLKAIVSMFETAYLEVSSIGIAELALRNLVALIATKPDTPVIVISLEEGGYQLQILYDNHLYLVRELTVSKAKNEQDPGAQELLLEIQRSMDYCLSELKLPEPKQILFTPGFYESKPLLQFLQQELSKEIRLLNLNDYLEAEPSLGFKEQQACFYSLGGAMTLNQVEQQEPEPVINEARN